MPEAERFAIEILEWNEVHSLPGDWGPDSLRAVLERAEIEDAASIEDAHLLDMALMALQDLEIRQACGLVLELVMADRVAKGVQQNLIDDLQDDRPWEQFADLRHQVQIFTSVVLLQQAYPTRFGKPDAAHVQLAVKPKGDAARSMLRDRLDASMALRLLAPGMDEKSVLRRLYGAPLAGESFPEARSIVWRMSVEAGEPTVLDVYSSLQWLGPLEHSGGYEARAWPDARARGQQD